MVSICSTIGFLLYTFSHYFSSVRYTKFHKEIVNSSTVETDLTKFSSEFFSFIFILAFCIGISLLFLKRFLNSIETQKKLIKSIEYIITLVIIPMILIPLYFCRFYWWGLILAIILIFGFNFGLYEFLRMTYLPFFEGIGNILFNGGRSDKNILDRLNFIFLVIAGILGLFLKK